jgi:hypothetical protein
MKKLLFLSIFAIVSLQGGDLERLYDLYTQKAYEKACQLGLRMFGEHKKNSKFLMLYAFSCLNADYVDRLAVPMIGLRATKTERANASYFATILLQKKLLYYALLDHVDISDLNLPKTDYILSKVFDLYVKKAYRKIDDKYYLTPEQGDGMKYVLYMESTGRFHKLIIEEMKNDKIIKIHRYW